MNATDGMDVSKILSLIMENPRLIEEISALARGDGERTGDLPSDAPTVTAEEKAPEEKDIARTITEPVPKGGPRADRNMLLKAFKPYLSKERAKALDSVISIVEILDMMRAR